MSTQHSQLAAKSGLPPGALIHVGTKKTDNVKITCIRYNQASFQENTCPSIKASFDANLKDQVFWINIDGLHDTKVIAECGELFNLHPLLLEDILNTRHRPNTQNFDYYVSLSLKMLGVSADGKRIVVEQVSFVVGENWILSFQEQEGDLFDGLRDRMREGKGKARVSGADYLFYRLVDTIVDNYFLVADHLNQRTENLEGNVLQNPDTAVFREIQLLKRMHINFRKSVSPLREAISALQKDEVDVIQKTTHRYLKDVYDHVIQTLETIETQRDILSSLMDLYHSMVSNRMNEIMKVLTIMATIFIPLTFIAGIYGMNFEYMPELGWKYGYFVVWALMISLFVGMLIYFRRKKWI